MKKQEQVEETAVAVEAAEEAPKKKKSKKGLIVGLAFLLIIAVAVTVFAVSNVNANKPGLHYRKAEEGDGYVVTSYMPTDEERAVGSQYSITIPAEYKGQPVVQVNNFIGSSAKSHVTNVSLPDSIKRIGACTFMDMFYVKTITVGKSLEVIEREAFRGASLREIRLPKTLKSIGEKAFMGCHFRDEEGDHFTLYFEGTAAEWAAIEKSSDWNEENRVMKVVCEGEGRTTD